MANGKGSGRRPAAVDDAQVASEWERIFGPPPEIVEHRSGWNDVARGPRPLQRPAQPPPRPITTDLGSEFIRSIHDVASEPREQ